jgi:Predicted membrane protein/domain
MEQHDDVEYAGFWIRTWASIIDSLLQCLILFPLLYAIYGAQYFTDTDKWIHGPMDFLLSWVLPAIAVVLFWTYKSATPGKMIISAKIVDAQTGRQPTLGQFIGRYFAYFVSLIPLGLGLFWVAFDKRKQGWHDKLAGTVVIRKKYTGPEAVKFSDE